MAKIDQEIKELKSSIAQLDEKVGKLQFYLIQIMNKFDSDSLPTNGGPTAAPGTVNLDIAPLEDRLEQLRKTMVSKEDLQPLLEEMSKLSADRMKDAEETIDNVTVLLEKGLALTDLTSSLKEIEAHLRELVSSE
jgi:hypothetical protein